MQLSIRGGAMFIVRIKTIRLRYGFTRRKTIKEIELNSADEYRVRTIFYREAFLFQEPYGMEEQLLWKARQKVRRLLPN